MGKLSKDQFRNIHDIDFKSIAETHIRASAITPEIGEFRIAHTTRVGAICISLARDYEEINILKLVIAAQVHDMYKYLAIEGEHGYMAAKWLWNIVNQYALGESELTEWKLVCDALKHHSEGDSEKKDNLYATLLYEADKLDHITSRYNEDYHRLFASKKSIEDVVFSNVKKVITRVEGKSENYDKVFENLITGAISLVDDVIAKARLIENIKDELETLAKKN